RPSPDVVPFLQPSNTQPRLAIPTVAASKPVRNSEAGGSAASGNADAKSVGGDADLLVLGVDPSGPATDISLPAGNRWGSFSISPVGGVPGSAGGVNYGIEGGGKGGIGAGGDEMAGGGP